MTLCSAPVAEYPEPRPHSAASRTADFLPVKPLSPAPEHHRRSQGADLQQDRDALYEEFAPLVRRLIRQYGQDAEMRRDLQGEIYYRFCALLDSYDPGKGVPLRPYLVRQLTAAVYTYARCHWRRQKREIALLEQPGSALPPPVVDPTPGWVQQMSQQQLAASLPDALAKLSERQRRIVIWRYYEERSFEEIAEILGVQLATARSLLRHGLNSLRKHMGIANWPEE